MIGIDGLKRYVRRTPLLERALSHGRALRLRRRHPEGQPPPAPRRIIVEPTNACNLSCAYCGQLNMTRKKTCLPVPLYRQLLGEMVELEIPRLTLHTIGEPLLHPQLPELVSLAREAGRFANVSTNGTLLTEDLARALVEAGLEILNVSVDAGDQESFARTRGGAQLSQVLEGIRHVRRFREEYGELRHSPWGDVLLPTIAATVVVTDEFTPEVERKLFETVGPLVDDFYFHFPNNHAGFNDAPEFHPRGLLPRFLRDRLYRALRSPCYYPWDALFLLSDGSMSVCRFDFDARVVVGEYGPNSITDLWNNDRMRSLRREHLAFRFDEWKQCERCEACWYENRAEHLHLTQKIKERNGFVTSRNAWQPPEPYAGVRQNGGEA